MHGRRGFSLVELLVVIAIISVLVALLLPILKRARDLATSVACTTNLKQVGVSAHDYADDHRQFFPGGTEAASGNASSGNPYPEPHGHRFWSNWMWDLWHYIGDRAQPYSPYDGKSIQAYYPTHAILACPIFPESTLSVSNADYGINMFIMTDSSALVDAPYIFRRRSQVTLPSSTHLLSDTSERSYDYMAARSATSYFVPPAIRHFDGNNNLFVDGHARWLHKAETVSKSAFSWAFYGSGYDHPLYNPHTQFPP